MAEPITPPPGPRRTGRAVPMSPDDLTPEEVARMTGIVDATERAPHLRHAEGNRTRGPAKGESRRHRTAEPAIARHGASTGGADPYHPQVRGHLVAMEKLLRSVEQTTYQRMFTVFDDWVELTNILLDSLPGHLREAVETGRVNDWPEGTPPERITAFSRIRARYGEKAPDAFARFSHATGEFLEATHDCWFDWMGQMYMSLELGGRGIGDYDTPWPVAYMMAEIQDISALLHTRMKEALMHEENALGAAVGIAGLLFPPGPAGQPPVMSDGDRSAYFTRWVIPAAVPFFDPITVSDPACGSGVMILASAATVPLWARRYGFVQYFGMDISPIAVQMAKAQTRAYGLNGYETAMVQAIDDAGWEKFRARLQASAAQAEAVAEAEAARAARPPVAGPPLTVIPREDIGHVAHPTLRRKAAAQTAPTIRLPHPTPEQAARLLSSRPRPQATAKGRS